jgi:hypothetical protein
MRSWYFYLLLTGKRSGRQAVSTRAENNSQLPVPNLDFSNPTDKARRDEMIIKVEAVLEAKKAISEGEDR